MIELAFYRAPSAGSPDFAKAVDDGHFGAHLPRLGEHLCFRGDDLVLDGRVVDVEYRTGGPVSIAVALASDAPNEIADRRAGDPVHLDFYIDGLGVESGAKPLASCERRFAALPAVGDIVRAMVPVDGGPKKMWIRGVVIARELGAASESLPSADEDHERFHTTLISLRLLPNRSQPALVPTDDEMESADA